MVIKYETMRFHKCMKAEWNDDIRETYTLYLTTVNQNNLTPPPNSVVTLEYREVGERKYQSVLNYAPFSVSFL